MEYKPTFLQNKLDNVISITIEFENTNRLLSDSFSSFAFLHIILSNGSMMQFQILEEIKRVAAAVSSGFLNIKLPYKFITDSLLSRV
jgi:hypothetical protein